MTTADQPRTGSLIRRRTAAIALVGLAAIAVGILVLGGTTVTSYTAVGYVKPPKGKNCGCTGTLVDANFFVTAAHCLDCGNEMSLENHVYTTPLPATCVAHKNYDHQPPYYDVAVCKLSAPLQDATPTPLGTSAAGRVTYVGYGPDSLVRFFMRRPQYPTRGTGTVFDGALRFLRIVGNGIDDGDSGGPVFSGEPGEKGPLIGVLSCHQDPGNQPRAVNLTEAGNRDWVVWCMKHFDDCKAQQPSPHEPEKYVCTG
jgi:hypothetical protein